jgi:hypothetical protein
MPKKSNLFLWGGGGTYFFLEQPLVFSPEKNIYKKLRCNSTVKIQFGRKKDIKLCLHVEKWSR